MFASLVALAKALEQQGTEALEEREEQRMSRYTAWSQAGGDTYTPAVDTVRSLPAGLYEVGSSQMGIFFVRDDESDRELLRFDDSPSKFVVDELEKFWTQGHKFKKHGLPHKRGVLLYGPPGGGKTCTLQLIARDVIDREGLVFKFSSAFHMGYRILREVEPTRPIVCLLEDLDSIITPGNESAILNILDGIGNMSRCVFVASTNYPENLPPRLINRPSRFDRRVLIGMPATESRHKYLESLRKPGDKLDVGQWVKDTDGFSFAHLKELFISVLLLGNPYEQALGDLQEMIRLSPKSSDVPTGVKINDGQYI